MVLLKSLKFHPHSRIFKISVKCSIFCHSHFIETIWKQFVLFLINKKRNSFHFGSMTFIYVYIYIYNFSIASGFSRGCKPDLCPELPQQSPSHPVDWRRNFGSQHQLCILGAPSWVIGPGAGSNPQALLLFLQPVGFFRDSNPGIARPIDPAGPKMVSLGYFRKRSLFSPFHPDLSDIAAAHPASEVQGYSYLANNPSCSYMLERGIDAFSA